jgi:hypothetical protein
LSQTDPIPKPTDINALWLTQNLGLNVSAVSAQAVGTGQVGATYRFLLSDAEAKAGHPASLIGKFMSEDPVSRATGIAQLSYVREVKFYQHYGNTKPLPIPTARYAMVDEATHDFALLMDDFPNHRPGNHGGRCQHPCGLVGRQRPRHPRLAKRVAGSLSHECRRLV